MKYRRPSSTTVNHCCSSSRMASSAVSVPASSSVSLSRAAERASWRHRAKPIERPVALSNTPGVRCCTNAAFIGISKACCRCSRTAVTRPSSRGLIEGGHRRAHRGDGLALEHAGLVAKLHLIRMTHSAGSRAFLRTKDALRGLHPIRSSSAHRLSPPNRSYGTLGPATSRCQRARGGSAGGGHHGTTAPRHWRHAASARRARG